MTWQDRFDRLLGAMARGEPHKGRKVVNQDRTTETKNQSGDEGHRPR